MRFGITQSDGRNPSDDNSNSDGASGYSYYEVEVPFGRWNRKGIINAIIRAEYTVDEELSILRDRDDDEDGYERYRAVLILARETASNLIPYSGSPAPCHHIGLKNVVRDLAKYVRPLLAALSDEDAALYPALFPSYQERMGSKVVVGERLWDDGRLFKALKSHTASEKHYPSQSPKYFAEISLSNEQQ